jgi:RNA polymerase sigma factor (sigma-70 family)
MPAEGRMKAPESRGGAGAKEPTIFVVDDDRSTLKVVTRTISSAGWNVRSFSSPQAFLDAYGSCLPGCIVLDLRMPGMTGLVVQERLALAGFHSPIIFITAFAEVSTAVAAMKGGAIDYLEKPFSSQQLLGRIEEAVQRDRELRRRRAEQLEIERRLSCLTPRERQVLELLLAGKLNREIAEELRIARRTVEVHRCNVMKKMRATTAIDLARIVMSARQGPGSGPPLTPAG